MWMGKKQTMTTSMSTDTKSRTTIFLLTVNFLQLYKTHFHFRFHSFFAYLLDFRDNVKIIFSVLSFCRRRRRIGKMFKSAELPWLITFFQMFYNDKPVDWLLEHLIYTKVCNWEKDMVRRSKKNNCEHFLTIFSRFSPSFRNIANTRKLSFGFTISLHYSNTSVWHRPSKGKCKSSKTDSSAKFPHFFHTKIILWHKLEHKYHPTRITISAKVNDDVRKKRHYKFNFQSQSRFSIQWRFVLLGLITSSWRLSRIHFQSTDSNQKVRKSHLSNRTERKTKGNSQFFLQISFSKWKSWTSVR